MIYKETDGAVRRVRMGWALSCAAVLACSAAVCVMQLVIQQGGALGLLKGYMQQPLLFVLNGFPVVAVMTLGWMACGNVFYSAAFSTFVFGAASYANLLKIEGREDPLVPSDITLLREAASAVAEYSLDMHWWKLALAALLLAVFVFLGTRVKSASLKPVVRVTAALVVVLGFGASLKVAYSRESLYNNFKVPYRYNIAEVFNTLGFNYCFLYNLGLYKVDAPQGFDKAEIAALEKSELPGVPEFRPDVIIIMCEAFTDLADEACFTYTEEENPLKAYHEAVSRNAVSGHLLVPNYGAGTANTEFDVLTGMQTNMVGNTSSFRLIHKSTKSLASVFADAGYYDFFMHPGESWFYNRNSVYKYLGIDDQTFKDAFDESDYKGQMISDAAFLDELRKELADRADRAPLFAYTVTIENHQSYWYGKLGVDTPYAPLADGLELGGASADSISTYMEGVKDSSEMLLNFCNYMDTLERPTLVVFFGDHRPNLGSAPAELGLNYNDFTTLENTVDSFSVPFMIRANDAYVKARGTSFEDDAARLGLYGAGGAGSADDPLITANYLPSVILELIGFEGRDPFFDRLMELRREVPVIKALQSCYLTSGGLTGSVSSELSAKIDLIHRWMYYRLKY